MKKIRVASIKELIEANKKGNVIEITTDLESPESIKLENEVSLTGKTGNEILKFAKANNGLELTENNIIKNLIIKTDIDKKAIFFGDSKMNGKFYFKNLNINGLINLIITKAKEEVELSFNKITINKADALNEKLRPNGYGVDVLQGALTIYNLDKNIQVKATLKSISIGVEDRPVFGSGIFISGTDNASVQVASLETDEVHSYGKIKPGTPDLISGGVFIVTNTFANKVINNKVVKTYGYNDMVLDNWGTVNSWVAKKEIISKGTSGIGFVNFGNINTLSIRKMIKTFGTGARGINNYDGTINNLTLYGIETHGDGAVGIQVSKPMGNILVKHNIETFGGTGESLVKGVIKTLSAICISILKGSTIKSLVVRGKVIAHDKSVEAVQINGKVKNKLSLRKVNL